MCEASVLEDSYDCIAMRTRTIDSTNHEFDIVHGRNGAPPRMYKTLQIMG